MERRCRPPRPAPRIGLHLPNGLFRQYSLLEASPSPASYTVGISAADGYDGDWDAMLALAERYEQVAAARTAAR